MDAVDREPKAINYAAQVGHSSLRTWAMGSRAFEGPAGDDEIAEMEAQLRLALQAGAYGFTTSRSLNHQTPADQPVASRLADWTEVERLVRVLGEVNRGVFQLAQEPAALSPDLAEREAYEDRLMRAGDRQRCADRLRRRRDPSAGVPQAGRGEGGPADRPGPQPRHLGHAVLPDPLAV